jgi:MFS family permease
MATTKACSVVSWPCLRLVNVSLNSVLFRESGINTISETDGYIDNPTQKGWLTAILELGAWFGALFSGFVAEVLSRKYGILCATGVFIVGVVVQITAISGGHNEILAGRFITYVELYDFK